MTVSRAGLLVLAAALGCGGDDHGDAPDGATSGRRPAKTPSTSEREIGRRATLLTSASR